MFSTILLAWEQSHPSQRALALARELRRVYDAELTVALLVREHETGELPSEIDAFEDDADHVVLPCSRPSRDVVEFAHEHGFDVIVVGHHPPEHVHRIFTHDTALEILEQADVPVLIVAEDDLVEEHRSANLHEHL